MFPWSKWFLGCSGSYLSLFVVVVHMSFSITMVLFIEICGVASRHARSLCQKYHVFFSWGLSMNLLCSFNEEAGYVRQVFFNNHVKRLKGFNVLTSLSQEAREIRMLEWEWVRASHPNHLLNNRGVSRRVIKIATKMEHLPIKQKGGWLYWVDIKENTYGMDFSSV